MTGHTTTRQPVSLNWTKVGLKDENYDWYRYSRIGLNWTKVGLKAPRDTV